MSGKKDFEREWAWPGDFYARISSKFGSGVIHMWDVQFESGPTVRLRSPLTEKWHSFPFYVEALSPELEEFVAYYISILRIRQYARRVYPAALCELRAICEEEVRLFGARL